MGLRLVGAAGQRSSAARPVAAGGRRVRCGVRRRAAKVRTHAPQRFLSTAPLARLWHRSGTSAPPTHHPPHFSSAAGSSLTCFSHGVRVRFVVLLVLVGERHTSGRILAHTLNHGGGRRRGVGRVRRDGRAEKERANRKLGESLEPTEADCNQNRQNIIIKEIKGRGSRW